MANLQRVQPRYRLEGTRLEVSSTLRSDGKCVLGLGDESVALAGEKVQVPPPSPFSPKLQPGSQQVKKTFSNGSGCLWCKYAEERIKSPGLTGPSPSVDISKG